MTLQGRTLEEMRAEAVTLTRIYVKDAREIRNNGTGRQHAYLLRKAAAQRKRAEFLTYCIRHRQ